MIDPKIRDFLKLIRHGSNVNSYKLAWAKAIVEISKENDTLERIYLKDIAKKMFKYYWNQTIYFDLIQGNNPNKRSEFVQEVRMEIENYFIKSKNQKPVHFEKAEEMVKPNYKKLITILKKDVSWRFLKIGKEQLNVYGYERGGDYLELDFCDKLSGYSDILYEAINYKWTQILENFNTSPRIAKKVRIIDFPNIKRKSLTPFKKYLDIENSNHICFICLNEINDKNISIDHVIPWSFMFSDDLWNLVYCHKSCNSIKSNILVDEEHIVLLEKRNIELIKLLNSIPSLKKSKPYRELEIATERDYLRKFWINYKN